ncbi:MAG: hypothetical protein BWY22_01249 [Bacteroidetes bacterium ADurb.Bin217]|nr:MAG: hypothetical protein BWY22_01249 [Bacteroidetes bacterium ADurb.Bin217]
MSSMRMLYEYKFGFNGQVKDDEIYGEGNWLSFGDYGYDSRLGRRPCPDPEFKKGPDISPYSVFFNNPISFEDPEGKWPGWVHERIIRTAFKNEIKTGLMTAEEVDALIQASIKTDAEPYQAPQFSFMHSMRDGTQTIESAQQKQREFINEKTNKYLQTSDEVEALGELGMALHSISDEDAPTHNWQSWSGLSWYEYPTKGLAHFIGEVTLWGMVRSEEFDRSVEKVRTAYYEAKEMKDQGVTEVILLPTVTVFGVKKQTENTQSDCFEAQPADNTNVQTPIIIE